MILLFDIGNSTIGVALAKENSIISNYRLNTDLSKTYDEYFYSLKSIIDIQEIKAIAISSVVPRITEQIIKLSRKYFQIEPLVVEVGVKTGISVKTDAPKEVGSDLICDCAGLEGLANQGVLIIDLGTATKYLYCKDNAILGAIITCGIAVSQKALVTKTALLPDVELKVPSHVLGRNTTECIQSGSSYAVAAQIDGLIERIKLEVKEDFLVLTTGGLSSFILPLCQHKMIREPLLVFKGLLKIYHKNKEGNNE
ncbi:MAG: type III pantothenate kinase [Acholeplasmatales bacterium]|nr:type III pantothenate kinase [Acholeplasmatales bacterium]